MDYTEDKIKRVFQIILGVCCCASAYKFFLAPAGLYNGGFTGIAQIIRNLLQEVGGFTFRSDPTGILVWCLNIPLMIIGYRVLGRMFMVKTIAVITMQSMLMTVIKGPEAQLISDHALNCERLRHRYAAPERGFRRRHRYCRHGRCQEKTGSFGRFDFNVDQCLYFRLCGHYPQL